MTERVWTVRDALEWTTGYLDSKGIEQARVSSERLLSTATGLTRVELYAYHDRPLAEDERRRLRDAVSRRAAGEPLQYVVGEVPFRHIVLRVRPGVFIPRPETEVLAGEVVAFLHDRASVSPTAVDLCTGSGAVALSVAHEVPGARVIASDVSPEAVELARENARALDLEHGVTVVRGDLFDGVPESAKGMVDVVVANPPYIPTPDLTDLPHEVVEWEPSLALDGGYDGLDLARRITDAARPWLAPGGLLALELDTGRISDAVKVMSAWYEGVRTVRDLAGRDRIVLGTRP